MGGSGSGNFGRTSKKTTTEACLLIDANRWMRDGTLKAGVHQRGVCRWTYRSGNSFAVNYTVNTLYPTSTFMLLAYSWTYPGSDELQSESYLVNLTTTQPRFGGLRWWFVCPLTVDGKPCNRRVGKLYLPPRGRWFGCRTCHNLTYTSCQESGAGKWLFGNLAAKLGCTVKDIQRTLRQAARDRG